VGINNKQVGIGVKKFGTTINKWESPQKDSA